MAISHKDHDHPNTPAARAACRKAMASSIEIGATPDTIAAAFNKKPAQVTVVPRKRGDGGVVKGMQAAAPKNVKRPNTLIKADHDLADVPRMLAYGVRLAWAADWDVKVGDRFNENEARIEIHGDLGIVSLVWRDKRPDGIYAIWVRNFDSSKQFKVDSVQHALELVEHDATAAWDEFGNLID